MNVDLDALLRFPIFSKLSATETSAVGHALIEREFAPGEVLFEDGSAGDSCFFLHLGRVQIDKPTTHGKHEVLAVLQAPTVLGEMAILRQAPRSARAVAMGPAVLWEMTGASLDELAEQNHAAAYKILKWVGGSVSDRLADTNKKLIDIYDQPYKSIIELKQRLKEIQPELDGVELDDLGN